MSKDRSKRWGKMSSEHIQDEIRQYLSVYKTTARIAIQSLTDALQVSKRQIEEELINLIDTGLIYGFIEDQHFIRDLKAVGKCQLCDRIITKSVTSYQCEICYRRTCESCYSVAPTCPTHPQTQSRFIELPLTCVHCHQTIIDLEKLTKPRYCYFCSEPLSGLVVRELTPTHQQKIVSTTRANRPQSRRKQRPPPAIIEIGPGLRRFFGFSATKRWDRWDSIYLVVLLFPIIESILSILIPNHSQVGPPEMYIRFIQRMWFFIPPLIAFIIFASCTLTIWKKRYASQSSDRPDWVKSRISFWMIAIIVAILLILNAGTFTAVYSS